MQTRFVRTRKHGILRRETQAGAVMVYNRSDSTFSLTRLCVRVKICGITNEEDACLAARLGVDAVGLNFYAGSPRCVSEETAALIVRALPPFVEPVGLFVNDPLDE